MAQVILLARGQEPQRPKWLKEEKKSETLDFTLTIVSSERDEAQAALANAGPSALREFLQSEDPSTRMPAAYYPGFRKCGELVKVNPSLASHVPFLRDPMASIPTTTLTTVTNAFPKGLL